MRDRHSSHQELLKRKVAADTLTIMNTYVTLIVHYRTLSYTSICKQKHLVSFSGADLSGSGKMLIVTIWVSRALNVLAKRAHILRLPARNLLHLGVELSS
jgi:hypothetical protein